MLKENMNVQHVVNLKINEKFHTNNKEELYIIFMIHNFCKKYK